jgi:hypothetical protein
MSARWVPVFGVCLSGFVRYSKDKLREVTKAYPRKEVKKALEWMYVTVSHCRGVAVSRCHSATVPLQRDTVHAQPDITCCAFPFIWLYPFVSSFVFRFQVVFLSTVLYLDAECMHNSCAAYQTAGSAWGCCCLNERPHQVQADGEIRVRGRHSPHGGVGAHAEGPGHRVWRVRAANLHL